MGKEKILHCAIAIDVIVVLFNFLGLVPLPPMKINKNKCEKQRENFHIRLFAFFNPLFGLNCLHFTLWNDNWTHFCEPTSIYVWEFMLCAPNCIFVNWRSDFVQIFDVNFQNFLHLIEENFFPELLNASELNSGSMDMSSYDGSQSPRSGGAMTPNSRNKRMRTSFKHHQLRTMKSYFAINQNPDAKDLKQLAQKTGLSKRVLQVNCVNQTHQFLV